METRVLELLKQYIDEQLDNLYADIPEDTDSYEYASNQGKRMALGRLKNRMADFELQAIDEIVGDVEV